MRQYSCDLCGKSREVELVNKTELEPVEGVHLQVTVITSVGGDTYTVYACSIEHVEGAIEGMMKIDRFPT